MRRTTVGTAREGGGSFERPMIFLWVFGPDGLLIRDEWFDASDEDEALARFDELTAASPARSPASPSRAVKRSARRVPENAATAHLRSMNAAFAARDEAALRALFTDGFAAVQHSTGAAWDLTGTLASIRSLWRAHSPASAERAAGDARRFARVGQVFDIGERRGRETSRRRPLRDGRGVHSGGRPARTAVAE